MTPADKRTGCVNTTYLLYFLVLNKKSIVGNTSNILSIVTNTQ